MLHIIHCKNLPILKQLQVEEALLRTDNRNFCIINEGSPKSAVLGISCKPALHLNQALLKKKPIDVIKRFSGGGSVVVDDKTLFVSFIFNKLDHPAKAFPEPILRWTGSFYQKAWDIDNFQIQANDYAIGEMKCGGNAQYIQKNRWLHHTTFLWDYDAETMNYLLQPPKVPDYRMDRLHEDFLCKLKNHSPNQNQMIEQIKQQLSQEFEVSEIDLENVLNVLEMPHRKSTTLIHLE